MQDTFNIEDWLCPTMDRSFRGKLNSPEESVAVSLFSPSRSVLIAFGGIAGELGIPAYEFFNLTKDYKVNRIYVRDLYQAWYHMGLRQITYDILGIALFLNNLVTRMNAEQIVLIGNSMGGYAAILFGALINATEVHAFSPQTFIDKSNRQKFMDHRWETQLQRVYSNGNPQYFDLEPLICNYKGRCKFKIHFSPLDRLDQLHAEHLKDSSLISLFSYDVGGHNLVRTLRDSGVLEKLIAEVFEENPKRK